MIQWAKFASKAAKLGKKAKGAVKKDIKFAKQYPELTAATVAIGGLTGLGVAGLVKSQKKKNGK